MLSDRTMKKDNLLVIMCVLQSCRPSIGMGRIQALSVEAWLLSSLPFKVEDLSQTLPLRKHYSQEEGDVMTLFNLSL
jgi:hypothetical protein